jgi:Bifunctional DNA primase/polymerase, N-terminal
MSKKKKAGFGPKKKPLQIHKNWRGKPRQRNKGAAMTDTSVLDMAQQYGAAGLPVFPLHAKDIAGKCSCSNSKCSEPGKHPRVKEATTDSELVKKYWTKWPDAKIGMPLGSSSGFLALVVKGAVGQKTLRALEEKAK